MDTRSLKYFIAVFEESSISAAAKRCFVAQPSISTTIAQLEEQFGVRLFFRHRKGVTPTPEGGALYASAKQLLGGFDALKNLFKKEAGMPLPLTLSIMPTIDSGRMGEFLKNAIACDERLRLRLVEMSAHADARIVSERLCQKNERFLHLWDERYVIALPHGHRLTLQPSVALDDLHGTRFIERCLCEIHDDVAGFLEKRRIQPEVVARATNEEWAVALVAAGLGVAVVPESSIRDHDALVVREISGFKLVRKVGLAYDPSASMPAGLRLLLDSKAPRDTSSVRDLLNLNR